MSDAPPVVDVDVYAPSLGSTTGLSVEDTRRTVTSRARVDVSWAHAPLRFVPDDGPAEVVVADVWSVTLSGAAAAGPVLFGVAAPCSVWRGAGAGGMEVAGPLVVDPTVGARVSIREGDALPGFGAAARLTVPTQAYVWSLGSPGPSWEALLVTDLDVGPTRLALDLGTRGVPEVTVGDGVFSGSFVYRGAAAWPIGDHGVTVEAIGSLAYRDVGASGRAAEGIVGGWVGVGPDTRVRLGVGAPLSRGIGAPAYRLVVAFEHSP